MASTDSGTAGALTVDDIVIVDADSHVGEDVVEDLLPYVDERHRAVERFIEGASNVGKEVYSSTRVTPAFNQNRGTATGTSNFANETVRSPEPKLELMDAFDISHSVLTPGTNLNLASVNHEQTAVALASAYNSWVTDTFLDDYDEFTATLLVANQRPDAAAAEIDRLGDHDGIVGVQLPASGLVPPAGHEWYDPIYGAAQEYDLPIVMHTGNSASTPAFPVQRYWSRTFVEDHAFTFPAEAMWHLISLVFRGVPERFPDLEFVLQEAGVEWLPWMTWRLDDHYLQNSQDVPILSDRPSEYLRDQFYFTTQPLGHTDDQGALATILELAGGAETVMFATDHPHADFDPPAELLDPIRSHLDEKTIRGMMGETASDVFGLDV